MDRMADFPKSPPAQGDEDRRVTLLAVVIPMTLLSTVTVLLRVYTRMKVVHNLGWDDYIVMMAQTISLVGMALMIELVVKGTGRHMYYLSIENIVSAGLYFRIEEIIYILATVMVKCSVCLFLLRIMTRGTSDRLRWFLYALMAIMALLSVPTAIVILVQCVPLAAGWDPRVKGKCQSYARSVGIGYAQIAWSICTDMVCALFPILIFWNSQMNKRTKYALWAIMGTGVFAGVCGIVKIFYLGKLSDGDFTYNGVDINIWGPLEQNVGVIAASIPALQPLFKSLLRGSHSPSQSKPGARNNLAISTWKGSTTHALSTRSRTVNTGGEPGSESKEHILPSPMACVEDDGSSLDVEETKLEDVKYSGAGAV
ncbi:hypothetical protein MMC07_009103 [Pseudocyphellaria aurata]|nr:hypothetical protein [Pseudocyphellaria aurata]